MTMYRVLLYVVALSMLSSCASGQPKESSLPKVRQSPLTITSRDRFVWSCYMICFGIDRDYTGLFYDRPLDRPTANAHSRLIDLQNAVEAGINALSVDLFVHDRHALSAFASW